MVNTHTITYILHNTHIIKHVTSLHKFYASLWERTDIYFTERKWQKIKLWWNSGLRIHQKLIFTEQVLFLPFIFSFHVYALEWLHNHYPWLYGITVYTSTCNYYIKVKGRYKRYMILVLPKLIFRVLNHKYM